MSKLYFKNEVGKIYDDKIVIKTSKFPFNETVEVLIVNFRDKKLNILFLLTSLSFFGISFFVTAFNYFFIAIGILLFLFAAFKKYYNYFIEVKTLDAENSKSFKLKSRDIESANEFVEKAKTAIEGIKNVKSDLKNHNHKFKLKSKEL